MARRQMSIGPGAAVVTPEMGVEAGSAASVGESPDSRSCSSTTLYTGQRRLKKHQGCFALDKLASGWTIKVPNPRLGGRFESPVR